MGANDPPAREWIVEGFLPRGANVLLSAHGGVGKSLLVLQLAVAIAAGVPFFGNSTVQATVVALFAEDDADELHRRLVAVCRAMNVSIASLEGRLLVFDGVGCDVSLFSRRTEGDDGRAWVLAEPDVTPVYGFVDKACALSEADVLMLDGVSDCYDADENSRPQVRRYMSRCLRLVRRRRGSVVHVAHVDKAAARSGAANVT